MKRGDCRNPRSADEARIDMRLHKLTPFIALALVFGAFFSLGVVTAPEADALSSAVQIGTCDECECLYDEAGNPILDPTCLDDDCDCFDWTHWYGYGEGWISNTTWTDAEYDAWNSAQDYTCGSYGPCVPFARIDYSLAFQTPPVHTCGDMFIQYIYMDIGKFGEDCDGDLCNTVLPCKMRVVVSHFFNTGAQPCDPQLAWSYGDCFQSRDIPGWQILPEQVLACGTDSSFPITVGVRNPTHRSDKYDSSVCEQNPPLVPGEPFDVYDLKFKCGGCD